MSDSTRGGIVSSSGARHAAVCYTFHQGQAVKGS